MEGEMKRLKGKVAVVTGSASGLGRALAERAAQEGMKVVLADIDKKALAKTKQDLTASGASVLAVVTDVSKVEDVQALAKKTLDEFGAVHLLCNAAAVHCPKPLVQATLADWKWVAGVNLFGAAYTINILLPTMMKQDTECHIVNVAPVYGGFYALPYNGLYNVSEYGVVTMSEILSIELTDKYPKIGVTLLAPEYADRAILDSERHRPAELRNAAAEEVGGEAFPHLDEVNDLMRAMSRAETPPGQLAEMAFDAIREGKFYVFPHPGSKVLMRERLAHIDDQSNPVNILQLMGIAS
jgi:NAD(P)-dependent dehydrogenase (short-subunit alcohol dehydrogenase family)